jgi:lipid-binding SYLF domain-containing protein
MPSTLSSIQSSLPSWTQTKTTSKAAFDKTWKVLDKLGDPVNKLSNRLGSEAFWPTTLDKESDKAARILRSFCKDGFYTDDPNNPSSDAPRKPGNPRGIQRVIKKIPARVVKEAKGLAIFTTCRTGLWVSGAGGSGVLVAKKDDGTWSPPSGILLHTAGLGFLAGIDIYDCVVVINTASALAAFTKLRCTLGGEISAVAGPVGMGGILETEIHKRQAPVWTYLKSRGFYAGVQVDGTVVIERSDENERFYGERIKVADILAGKARIVPSAVSGLMNTLRMAQGEQVEEGQVPDGETPGDLELVEEKDSDPLGVHALEAEGIEIKEAGTARRPSVDEFEPHLSPRSATFRVSTEASRPRSNSKSTQTDFDTEDGLKKGEAVAEEGDVEKEQVLRKEPIRTDSSLEDTTDAQGVNVVIAS